MLSSYNNQVGGLQNKEIQVDIQESFLQLLTRIFLSSGEFFFARVDCNNIFYGGINMFRKEYREIYAGEPTQLLWLERSLRMCGIDAKVKRINSYYALIVSEEDEERARLLASEYVERYQKSMYDNMKVRELPIILDNYADIDSLG